MELCDKLANRVKIGTATSVKSEYWNGKEIYPENQLNIDLKLRVQELILLTEKVNQPDL